MTYQDKCWARCGAQGDHPKDGPHYYPCGTMKGAAIRGENCYEREIAALRELLEAWRELKDDLSFRIDSLGSGQIELFLDNEILWKLKELGEID